MLPTLVEQGEIGDALSSLDRRTAAEELYVSKLRTLKQGLTDDLLTGRVRVSLPEGAAA